MFILPGSENFCVFFTVFQSLIMRVCVYLRPGQTGFQSSIILSCFKTLNQLYWLWSLQPLTKQGTDESPPPPPFEDQPFQSESIEWFVEDHAFSPSHDLAPCPPPPAFPPVSKLSLFLSISVVAGRLVMTTEKGMGWGRSQIIRRRDSQVRYKWFNTPWFQ
jgi:hypothetical protein